MAYAAKYKIDPGPRGWVLFECHPDLTSDPWVEIGKYDTEEKALESLKRCVGKSKYYDENGEAV